MEDEEPTPRPPEPPTLCVEEQTEERPTFPQDGEVRAGAEESTGSEALRDSTENQRPTHPEGSRGGSNSGTDSQVVL
jgi:hypothetical protein